jgi:hypothetical protein
MISTKSFPVHACQVGGSDRKYVETIIDDEFIWSEQSQQYEPNGFTDMFEHTGFERCAECNVEWTGS